MNQPKSTTMLVRVKDDNNGQLLTTSVPQMSPPPPQQQGLLVRHHQNSEIVSEKKVTQFNNSGCSNNAPSPPACSARGLLPCRLHRSITVPTSASPNNNNSDNPTDDSHQIVNPTSNSNVASTDDDSTCSVVPSAKNDYDLHEQSESNHRVQPSKLLGEKYLLLNVVEGSSLYRCVNVHTQQEMVCKIVTRDSSSLLSAHYRLDGVPYMNPLHEVLVGERYLYLVFPKSHGDLHSHVRVRRRLREAEARSLFRQMAETVKTCHENGIVLRDLKLRKFVFADSQRSELKLESLEDAVVLEDPEDDILHDKRGCPAYVSPEILRAGAHYSGKAADMWSLGVILYTMLVGRYPFNDSEHASLFAKISRGHFVIPECLSSRAKCLIRSLLRREPSERIASEDVLLHPWLVREDRDSYMSSNNSRNNDQQVPDIYFDDEDD